MCLGDIALAIRAGSFEKRVTVTVAPTKSLSASPDRVGFIVGSHATVNLFLTFDQAAANSTGILIPAATQPLIFSLAEHGALVQKPIFIATSADTHEVVIWETIFSNLADTIARLGRR